MPETDPRRAHPRRVIADVGLYCYRAVSSVIPQIRQNIGEAILDISPGGARLKLTQPLAKGETVTVELKDPRSGESFRARGQIRWSASRAGNGSGGHFVGVQFSEVYTPVGQREKFTLGAIVRPPELAAAPRAVEKRVALRFPVDDYVVTCVRQGTLSAEGLKRNLARNVVDVSRTGVQLSVTEPLDAGTLVRFTLHLNQFADALEASGEVRWSRPDGAYYRAGLRFVNLSEDRKKMIDFMTKWFTRQKKSGA
jgi:c-di-GMP-binding flagellar brake protein YcgR